MKQTHDLVDLRHTSVEGGINDPCLRGPNKNRFPTKRSFTGFLTFFKKNSAILSDNLSGISFNILSNILSDKFSGILSHFLSRGHNRCGEAKNLDWKVAIEFRQGTLGAAHRN